MKKKQVGISRGEVLRELAAIGFAKATDYLQIEDGSLHIKSTDCLSREQAAAIAQVERTSSGLKLKLYDKLKALELLGKCVGLFDGGGVAQEPNNLLTALLAATGEEVKTHDLPEVQQAPESGNELVEPSGVEAL